MTSEELSHAGSTGDVTCWTTVTVDETCRCAVLVTASLLRAGGMTTVEDVARLRCVEEDSVETSGDPTLVTLYPGRLDVVLSLDAGMIEATGTIATVELLRIGVLVELLIAGKDDCGVYVGTGAALVGCALTMTAVELPTMT